MPQVPSAGGRVYSAPELRSLAIQAGFSATEADVAAAIAMAESGGRPEVTNVNTNGSTDYGLWQINSVHPDLLRQGNWKDPAVNARMARAVYTQAGSKFTPWSTFNSQHGKPPSYLKYLPTGPSAPEQAVTGAVDGALGSIKSAVTTNPLAGISSAFTNFNSAFGKLANGGLLMTAAVGLIIAGIVILVMHNDGASGIAKTAIKAVAK
jgi:hypothetical protein